MARQCWRTLEPYHGLVYFCPEANEEYTAIGLPAPAHYFAPRAAAMGPVPAEVVKATFFNFHPSVVDAAIPRAWEAVTPAAVIEARYRTADRALRRSLGDEVGTATLKEASAVARAAAEACHGDGRPLYAGHAALAWPDEPHLVLWHAITLLREFRGDGHIAAMVADGVTGLQALILHSAMGDIPRAALQGSRSWSDAEWDAGVESLRARGWLDGDGALTEEGRQHRQWVEDRTDELAMAPWLAIGDEAAADLRRTVRPWSVAISQSGVFGGLRG